MNQPGEEISSSGFLCVLMKLAVKQHMKAIACGHVQHEDIPLVQGRDRTYIVAGFIPD
jgi:hypothetical protein